MRSPCAAHGGLDRRSMRRLYNYWTSSPFLHSTVKLSIFVSAMYVDVATNDDCTSSRSPAILRQARQLPRLRRHAAIQSIHMLLNMEDNVNMIEHHGFP